MTPKSPQWPPYVHDETSVCEVCSGNGYVRSMSTLHPFKTCSSCCGSGVVTIFLERKAA